MIHLSPKSQKEDLCGIKKKFFPFDIFDASDGEFRFSGALRK